LIKSGFDPDVKDSSGRTVIDYLDESYNCDSLLTYFFQKNIKYKPTYDLLSKHYDAIDSEKLKLDIINKKLDIINKKYKKNTDSIDELFRFNK